MGWTAALLFGFMRLSVLGEDVPPQAADEPADREFIQKAAQEYYDALIGGKFDRTATREVFAVQSSKPDLPAYQKAMKGHPYVGAEKILALVADLDESGASIDLKITRNGVVRMERTTWSRTGSPKKWVGPMTRMTMAGMPGFEVLADDGPEKEKPAKPQPRVESKAVFKERNLQEGQVSGPADAPVRFVRPPKVMPGPKSDPAAYVMGFIENIGETPVKGITVKAVVQSESGETLETAEFRPSKPSLAPGEETRFGGNLKHLDPKRTTFSLTWE